MVDSLIVLKGILKNTVSNKSHPSRKVRLEKAKEAIALFRKTHELTLIAQTPSVVDKIKI